MSLEIDLRSTEVNIKFLRGTTIALTLYYLQPGGGVVDLTGYSGELIVTNPESGLLVDEWCLPLVVRVGDTTYEDKVITAAQGLYIEISPELTGLMVPDFYKFECLLVSPAPDVIKLPLAYGVFTPFE
jgi:hypothetical protein